MYHTIGDGGERDNIYKYHTIGDGGERETISTCIIQLVMEVRERQYLHVSYNW